MLDTANRIQPDISYRSWMVACAAAETVGMATAAAAAKLAERVGIVAGLGIVVAAGLVEGVALGAAQASMLRRLTPALRVRRFVLTTVAAAGLGWAAGSAPAALSSDSQGGGPPLVLVVGGALALGLAMGSVLGAAQAMALRGAVRHPWRWVTANAFAWPPTMATMFVGATLPQQDWPVWSVAIAGGVTGAVAGAVLGAVSGPFLPSLIGPSLVSRLVLSVMASRHRDLLPSGILGLEVIGRASGHPYRLPVQWAIAPGGLVIVPGRPGKKTWWRNLDSSPTAVQILREGVWAPASAHLVRADETAYAAVVAAYRERWPHARLEAGQPVVRVRLGGHSSKGPAQEWRGRSPSED